MSRSSIAGILVTCLLLLTANTESAGVEKKVITHNQWKAAPIKFNKVSVAGKEVAFDQEFDGDDGWLRDFAVTIENTSNKNIASGNTRNNLKQNGSEKLCSVS
jgi:hypothetical protein